MADGIIVWCSRDNLLIMMVIKRWLPLCMGYGTVRNMGHFWLGWIEHGREMPYRKDYSIYANRLFKTRSYLSPL